MAAFRKARAERADAAAAPAADGGRARSEVADAGLVRIASPRGSRSGGARRPRRFRPARLALAAVLAVGMAGGAALAAGTGALRAPFGNDDPHPGSSVSAAASPPERPLVSPSPGDAAQGGSTPDGTPSGGSTGGAGDPGRDAAGDDPAPKPGSGDRGSGDRGDRPRDSRGKIASACRDLRDGKRLDADRRRALREAAGGSRVGKHCKSVLSESGGRSGGRQGEDTDRRHREDRSGEQDRKRDEDGKKAERKGDRKAERKAERKAGERADKRRAERRAGDAESGDRGRSTRSLAPLRPAVSYSLKMSWPRV
jgi:hypothetical protein